uniref:MARVEL domain containing 2b n=1 Tax=Oryzias sinensis TaxID=183150 RepID=A0A8C7Z6K4_9TELE
MSSRGFGRFDRVRDFTIYDEVAADPPYLDTQLPPPPPPPTTLNGMAKVPALSLDPLPPPPLPDQPAVGPESFYSPSDSEPPEGDRDAMDIKPVRRFIPDSVKNFFRGSSRRQGSKTKSVTPAPSNHSSELSSKTNIKSHTTGGVPCSPPNSAPPIPFSPRLHNTSTQTYQERVEEYHLRYAYMKSWAGLLRILGAVQLLLGAAVFACVCAYVHKDNEWFNMFGYSQPQLYGGLGGGVGGYGASYYTGPKTPFVLVVVGLAWIVTIILVVMGMTLYYRAILLDSSWWPLTECSINLVLAILYMAAAIVYVLDTTRGGLCYTPVFNNGMTGAFCRTEAGQTAAIIFLFITMVLYFISAGVCLKLWRHEAARMRREAFAQEVCFTTHTSSLHCRMLHPPLAHVNIQGILQGHIPAGHIPKPVVIADYIVKYPSIHSAEDRDRYKAVFTDQYAEYRDIHKEVEVMAKKFEEMDRMMQDLASRPSSQMEQERINKILMEYQMKKADPTYLEKRDRCEYLKNKLSHIKQKIQEYDQAAG